jgi:hypothetical protein
VVNYRAGAEHLGFGLQFGVNFETDNGFEFAYRTVVGFCDLGHLMLAVFKPVIGSKLVRSMIQPYISLTRQIFGDSL